MKFKNAPPQLIEIREIEEENIINYSNAILMLAITPKKDIVVVSDIKHHSLWKNFWKSVSFNENINKINLKIDPNDDSSSISHLKKYIIQGLNYIIAKGYFFLGLCYISPNILHEGILKSGLFSKRKNKPFIKMNTQFRERRIFPKVNQNEIEVNFIGKGEKFINMDYKIDNFPKISERFKGSLTGVITVEKMNELLNFVILGQNISQEKTVKQMVIDETGRDTLFRLEKEGNIVPISGFRLDYGLWGLKNLKEWESFTLLPDFNKKFSIYQKYLKSKIQKSNFPIEIEGKVSLFNDELSIELKKHKVQKKLTVDELLERSDRIISNGKASQLIEKNIQKTLVVVEKIIEEEEGEQKSINKEKDITSLETTTTEKIIQSIDKKELSVEKAPEKPIIPSMGANIIKPKIPQSKPDLKKLNIPKAAIKIDSVEDNYEDVLNKKEEIFSEDGKAIMEDMDEGIYFGASKSLDEDLGISIDPSLMSEEDIFKDLESSLEAISQLDKIGSKDEAVSRIYFPPPTLISFAGKEGMEIGGSTVVMSMNTGRNIYLIPELKRMQMYGKFYEEKDLNDQIEDFIAMEEKNIDSPDELEDLIQKAFINIKKNNRIFIGILEIEGNGFESDPGFGFELDPLDMEKLMQIHIKSRQTTEFPRLSDDSYIEVRYYGKPELINFISNPKSQGTLDIAFDTKADNCFEKGMIGGIICSDFEAVYFFILTHNFDQLENNEPLLDIDKETIQRMFNMIDNAKLTPVSWFKMSFGFNGFDSLFFWEDVKDSFIIKEVVIDKYNYYLSRLIETKLKEDEIKNTLEQEFSGFTDIIQKLDEKSEKEGKTICNKCGEDIPHDSGFCPACGTKITE